jgi:hypothetical protein
VKHDHTLLWVLLAVVGLVAYGLLNNADTCGPCCPCPGGGNSGGGGGIPEPIAPIRVISRAILDVFDAGGIAASWFGITGAGLCPTVCPFINKLEGN